LTKFHFRSRTQSMTNNNKSNNHQQD